jgi:antirestriction protein ArdC
MSKTNVFEIVKERLLNQLSKGHLVWKREWLIDTDVNSNVGAVSYVTGKYYNGLNQMLLAPGEYVTFNQIKKLKAKLKKGSKSEVVVYWKIGKYTTTEINENGEEEEKERTSFLLRYYRVFHIEDTDLEPKFNKPKEPLTVEELNQKEKDLENIMNNYLNKYNITLNFGGNRAFYSPMSDSITLPQQGAFKNNVVFLKTKAHEIIHSTGHTSRLNRLKGASFGSRIYSYEELIAESGATMLASAFLGVDNINFDNSQAYINSWIKYFEEESAQKLVSAFTKAEKAVELILNSMAKSDTKKEEKIKREEIKGTQTENTTVKTTDTKHKSEKQWLLEQEIIKNKWEEYKKMYPKKLKEYDLVFDKSKSSYGRAYYVKKIISISLVFLAYNPVEKMLDTLAHEVAHALLGKKTRNREIKPHGKEWRRLARQLGSDGKATHKSANPVVSKYKAVCEKCGEIHYITKKTKHFNNYLCVCKNRLKFSETPKEDFAEYLTKY